MNPRRARRRRRSREHQLRERVAGAIRASVADVIPDVARRHVNYGWCSDVAEGARERLLRLGITAVPLRDDDELCSSSHPIYRDDEWTHEWIWVEGRHYDAEALHGVDRWLLLPHFRRWLTPEPEWETDYEAPAQVVIEPCLAPGAERTRLFLNARFLRLTQRRLAAATTGM
jgi:hypothetical protein